jgi:hypothetical protein
VDDDFEENEEEEEIIPVEAVKPKEIPIQKAQKEPEVEANRTAKEIAMLQDNGIYRLEMLARMNRISDYHMVIADSIAKLTGVPDDQKT